MLGRLTLAAAFVAATSGMALAVPISGSFALTSFGGSYVGGTGTASTATGLDFGNVGGPSGNGYGNNGTALVGNATGDFVLLSGTLASIADIALGAGGLANPFTSNPFISFASSPIKINFTNAAYTRSPLGTSVTVSGAATFTDNNPADTTPGTFSLSANSQNGQAAAVRFTFTSSASTNAVPEPMSIALLGTALLGVGMIRRMRQS